MVVAQDLRTDGRTGRRVHRTRSGRRSSGTRWPGVPGGPQRNMGDPKGLLVDRQAGTKTTCIEDDVGEGRVGSGYSLSLERSLSVPPTWVVD